MTKKVFLGLGSNLGDKETNIRKAIQLIGERVGQVIRQSSLIETKPWGFESENTFLNGVILRDMGRTVKSVSGGYADRIIDIDILLFDHLTVDEPDLKIPHPLMHERDFVMVPLNEIL